MFGHWRAHGCVTARYAYIWAGGIYLGAGIELENSCLLVVVGAREDGRKELLAMELGYRESTASWASVLRDLRDRGLAAPLLACGLHDCASGRELVATGFQEDVERAADVDVSETVPVLISGGYESRSRET